MLRFALNALALVLFACGTARPPYAPTEARDASAPSEDASAALDAPQSELDSGMTPDLPAMVLPELREAVRKADPRQDVRCADVPGVTGFYTPPSLHVIGDDVYVFSVDSTEATPRLLMHESSIEALAFGEPQTLLYGARTADLILEGGVLRAVAGRQFYTLELQSSEGDAGFAETQTIGPHGPTYNCEGYPPPRYFRGRQPVELIALGNDYNTGLFGCYERVFVTRNQDGSWIEPVEIGRGDVVFAYHGDRRALIVTTLSVLASDDDAATWASIAALTAAGGVTTGTQLLLLQAAPEGQLVLHSDDDGTSWNARTRVLTDTAYGGAFIANDAGKLSVAVATATEVVTSTSFDDAASWSEPRRTPRATTERLLALAQHGDETLWLMAGEDDTLELCVLE